MAYLYLWGFFTPPVEGALFLAALVASCFLGALPPVDLRAVCLVRAIIHFNKLVCKWPTLKQMSQNAVNVIEDDI